MPTADGYRAEGMQQLGSVDVLQLLWWVGTCASGANRSPSMSWRPWLRMWSNLWHRSMISRRSSVDSVYSEVKWPVLYRGTTCMKQGHGFLTCLWCRCGAGMLHGRLSEQQKQQLQGLISSRHTHQTHLLPAEPLAGCHAHRGHSAA